MTVLVLTSTGATGSATLAALLRRAGPGDTILAATRDPAAAKLPAGARAVAFSLDDRATWAKALAGVDALYLCMPPFRTDEVEVGSALIDAAKAAGVRKIVKLSAIGVEHSPESGHRRLELYIEASGLDWVHLRPNFFHENFFNFYGATVRSDSAIYLPAGNGKTSFIAASDIGEAAATALLGPVKGEAWTLTGPESLDHAEVAAAIGAAIGRPVRYVDIAPEAHIAGMQSWGMPPLAVQTMSYLYGVVRAGMAAGISPDLERVTGSKGVRFADWAQQAKAEWA
jgi:uncharacterized protein YbjT (DUF2867 family)